MTQPNNSFDTLRALKRSEPLGFLASLSLIIATFTFEKAGFGAIYNYSVVSGFMFIISFVFSIAYDFYKHVPQRYQYSIADNFLRFGIYFFLGLGFFSLLYVAYEFGNKHTQIFAFVKIFLVLFGLGLLIYLITLEVKKQQASIII